MSEQLTPDLLGITARIVASHVASNHVEASALPSLILSIYRTVSSVDAPEPAPAAAQPPAVPVKKSVFPDFIVCLEDGKKLRMLKRYLKVRFGLTPNDYRTKWGLLQDYPMVAPNYASTRSALAKQSGFGRRPVAARTEPIETAEPATQLPARRARGSKG